LLRLLSSSWLSVHTAGYGSGCAALRWCWVTVVKQ
jgi:hypothetical protein